ncbi:PREDICTED: dynein light chain roadblock-type 1 [Chrysochloris asiatica]|nr:PREDICTED: dynein light chain roadblock-type 1 [Chrysochloris asiatica]
MICARRRKKALGVLSASDAELSGLSRWVLECRRGTRGAGRGRARADWRADPWRLGPLDLGGEVEAEPRQPARPELELEPRRINFQIVIQAEVEETLKRLQSQKGVQGIIVVNTEGIPIKSTMDNSTTTQYANLMHNFILKARSTVREIDPQNDLTFLRIRSKKNEIMVAPDKDYFLIVIQNPTE